MSELNKKLGLAFKAERERRNLDIGEVSDELKLSVEYLSAIEHGDLEFLPSELYYKLFTKSYAEWLGIDLTATIEAIKEELGIAFDSEFANNSEKSNSSGEYDENEVPARSIPDAENTVKQHLISFAIGLTVLVGIIIGIFALSSREIVGNSSSSASEAHEGFTADFAEYRSMLANYNWDIHTKTDARPLKITISSVDSSWATVLADGDTAIYRTIVPGRVYTAEARYRFLVSVGIPSRVTVKINGRKVNLRDSLSRRISRVEVNQVNKDNFPSGVPPRKRSTPAPTPSNQDSSQSKTGQL